MSFLRKQESRLLVPANSPSPGLAEGQAGLSTAWGEAGCFIRLKCYGRFLTLRHPPGETTLLLRPLELREQGQGFA